MTPRCILPASIVLCLFLGFVHCQETGSPDYADNSIDAERTHLSTAERLLKTILTPLQTIDATAGNIQSSVQNIISHLPGPLKGTFESGGRAAQGFGDILNRFRDRFRAIYPGTKWCGDGDIAENENDLGLFEKTDACCRAHDSCQNGIPSNQQRSGLLNNGIFTRSHCDCDGDFYRCLKDVHGVVSTKIGYTYFNILRPQCYREDYPIVSCKTYTTSLIDKRCTEYEFDVRGGRKEQWFDNPDF